MIGCAVVAGVALIAVIQHNLSVANPGKLFSVALIAVIQHNLSVANPGKIFSVFKDLVLLDLGEQSQYTVRLSVFLLMYQIIPTKIFA